MVPSIYKCWYYNTLFGQLRMEMSTFQGLGANSERKKILNYGPIKTGEGHKHLHFGSPLVTTTDTSCITTLS